MFDRKNNTLIFNGVKTFFGAVRDFAVMAPFAVGEAAHAASGWVTG
jgi:hypothetical protein